jgi:4-hydroxybenzoate polyprenyltransferase
MKNWILFFKERTPILSYLLLSLGPAASANALSDHSFGFSLFLAFFGFFLFLVVLRMMDEYKDFDKDVLAHPKRPLPRGLIQREQFKKGIDLGLFLMVVFDFFLLAIGLKNSFYLYSLILLHLWLMYKEFYVAEWINARPLLYAITHQLILVTICLYCLSVYRLSHTFTFSRMDLIFSFSVLFAFFCYEVCRKLDPKAHPVLKTYLSVYGINGVIQIVSTLLLMHVIAIRFLFQENVHQYFFYIPLFLLMLSLFLLKAKKIKFKIVEMVATLNLLVFLYSGILYVIASRVL